MISSCLPSSGFWLLLLDFDGHAREDVVPVVLDGFPVGRVFAVDTLAEPEDVRFQVLLRFIHDSRQTCATLSCAIFLNDVLVAQIGDVKVSLHGDDAAVDRYLHVDLGALFSTDAFILDLALRISKETSLPSFEAYSIDRSTAPMI